MNKLYIIICLYITTFSVSAQKLITAVNTANKVEGYFFKYDRNSGGYVYNDYDTTKKKSVILTTKGSSAEYDFEMTYNTIFDNIGNSYTVTYNRFQDTLYKYFLLKNNTEIISYDFIGDGWDINNGILYYYAKENGKYIFVGYNTVSGEFSKGKAYDEIYLANFTEQYYEDEPRGKIGYSNDGGPFYLASNKGEKFFVIGSEEQKHYSDIDWYMTKKDNNGELVYFAKSKGTFYIECGNAFLVQGNKEYKSFDYVNGPVLFDKNNNPVYTARDSANDYNDKSRIMIGNKEGITYSGNIYEYKITPSGKLVYVVSKVKGYNKGEDAVYENFIIVDGIESKHYNSVSNVTFTDWEVPVFTASNKDNKYFIVKGDKVISEKYDNIYDYTFMKDGSLAYIGSNFGNYEKQVPDNNFVHISGKKFGPYEFISMADYTSGKYILTDYNNNYAFVSGKLINPTEYIYKYTVTSNNGKSEEHDGIDIAKLINGKVVYISVDNINRVNYKNKYSLYIDNKLTADDYESIMDFYYDKSTGTLSFVAGKGNSFFLLEYKI